MTPHVNTLLAAASAANDAALQLTESARGEAEHDHGAVLHALIDAARLVCEANPARVEELHDLHRTLTRWIEKNTA